MYLNFNREILMSYLRGFSCFLLSLLPVALVAVAVGLLRGSSRWLSYLKEVKLFGLSHETALGVKFASLLCTRTFYLQTRIFISIYTIKQSHS